MKPVYVNKCVFVIQVKGVVEEIEKRAGEEINNIRPKTSNGKRGKKRELTFLRDLTASV